MSPQHQGSLDVQSGTAPKGRGGSGCGGLQRESSRAWPMTLLETCLLHESEGCVPYSINGTAAQGLQKSTSSSRGSGDHAVPLQKIQERDRMKPHRRKGMHIHLSAIPAARTPSPPHPHASFLQHIRTVLSARTSRRLVLTVDAVASAHTQRCLHLWTFYNVLLHTFTLPLALFHRMKICYEALPNTTP